MKRPNITQERVRELVSYEPETGIFRNRVHRNSAVRAGGIAGTKGANGYWQITLDRHRLYAHRLAWFYMHGEWPEIVDHINRDPCDNRLANLRPATKAQNFANGNLARRCAAGIRGVVKRGPSFRAVIVIGRKAKYLGTFKTAEEAGTAYERAAKERFGEFYSGPTMSGEAA